MNSTKIYKRGFTLIELLVVVGIISILAAVILAALGSARNKGGDAAVKSNLRNAISQGEIFYNTNTAVPNSYTGACNLAVTGTAITVGPQVLQAAKASGLAAYNDDGNPSLASTALASCNDSANAWAAEVPLKSYGANQMWCVDNLGHSRQENNVSIGLGTVCP